MAEFAFVVWSPSKLTQFMPTPTSTVRADVADVLVRRWTSRSRITERAAGSRRAAGAGAASRGTPVGARELAVEDAPAAQLHVTLEALGMGTDFGLGFVGELSGKFRRQGRRTGRPTSSCRRRRTSICSPTSARKTSDGAAPYKPDIFFKSQLLSNLVSFCSPRGLEVASGFNFLSLKFLKSWIFKS